MDKKMIRDMFIKYMKLPPIELRTSAIQENLSFLFPNFDKSDNAKYIYYQCFIAVLIYYLIFSVIYNYAIHKGFSIDFLFIHIPKFKNEFVLNHMKYFCFMSSNIALIVFIPYFFVKMKLNVPADYDFLSNNIQWKTRELQKKRKMHIIITHLIAFMAFIGFLYLGYLGILYFFQFSQLLQSKKIFLLMSVFYIFTAPFAIAMVLKCVVSTSYIINISKEN